MTHSLYQGIAEKGTKKKLFIAFGLVTLVFVVLFLVILPYQFYKRDVNEARRNVQNISKLIRAGVLLGNLHWVSEFMNLILTSGQTGSVR